MLFDRRAMLALALSVGPSLGEAVKAAGALKSRSGEAGNPLGIRDDFPISQSDITFLNTAYSAPIPRQVIAAGIASLERKSLEPLADPEDAAVRSGFARLINASPDEIGLLRSTGEAENVIARGLDLKAGDNVVISSLHYDNEFLLYRNLQRETAVEFRIVPHRNGAVEARDMESYVDKNTRLISVALVSHQNGYVHDLSAIANLAHAHGAYLYADAIQALGTIAVDVQVSGVDFLCAGAYKWLLARSGIAPFFVRRDLFQRLRLDRYGEGQISERLPNHYYEIYTDARRFEGARPPTGPTAELAASLKYIETIGLSRIESHTVGLGRRLQLELDRQGHRLFTPPGNQSPIVAFYINRPVPEARNIFAANKLNVTARDGTVRVSPALFNTADEIERFLAVAKALL